MHVRQRRYAENDLEAAPVHCEPQAAGEEKEGKPGGGQLPKRLVLQRGGRERRGYRVDEGRGGGNEHCPEGQHVEQLHLLRGSHPQLSPAFLHRRLAVGAHCHHDKADDDASECGWK